MLRLLRWLIFVLLVVVPVRLVHAEAVASLPAPTAYVSDFAGVLTPETKQSLEDLCTQVDHKAHAQIAVVTVKTIDADKSGATPSVEEFATALEDSWKVGKKGTDRGVLVIFVMNPTPVHGRIEVGYGLEGLLNDAKVGDIGREMKPLLVSGELDRGVALGVREIARDIAADAGVTLSGEGNGGPVPQYHYETQPQVQISSTTIFLVGGIVLFFVVVLIRTGHIGWLFFLLFNLLGGGGGRGGGGWGGGGGGGGNGDGGGGFGGFGGGGSGGGGADF